jgi:hypothetical protein
VGQRLEERGMVALWQPGLTRAALHDYRLGHLLVALFAAHLNKVLSALALTALEVYASPTPWLHQDTTTIALYGAYADEPQISRAPQPAYGHSQDGRDDLKQVLLRLGVSGEGGLPLRVGVRDGNRSDSVETPVAIAACLALGLEGVRGIVADSKASSRRTLGLCLERQIGLVTFVPRPCAIRQELEAWGRQQPTLPRLVEKPGGRRMRPLASGMGKACSAPWRSSTATDASLWRHCALSASMRANWRSSKPPRMPWPQRRKPKPWPTTGSGDRRGGLSVGLTPKPLLRSMRAEARDAEAAVHAPGAIMR